MIHLPASVRVYLCLTACDMRKSFDSLHALVREYLERTRPPNRQALGCGVLGLAFAQSATTAGCALADAERRELEEQEQRFRS
jgi:hypothetical protein